MKLKYKFEIIDMGEGKVAIPVEEGASSLHGIIKLNESGVIIMEALKEETTQDEIVKKLKETYDATDEQLLSAVKKFCDNLIKMDVLTK